MKRIRHHVHPVLKFTLIFYALAGVFLQAKEPYTPDWESLRKKPVPQWAKDAKFGIYAHWGPYSVTGSWDMETVNWGNLFICGYQQFYSTDPKNEMRNTFREQVGPIEKGYGYKDLARQFKAENFDPAAWAELIKKSGARYAGICAIHHDGYAMWDSKLTDLCATKLGPNRDLLGEILTEIKKQGLKTFTSFHHERTGAHFNKVVKMLQDDKEVYANLDLINPAYANYYWWMHGDFAQKRYELTVEAMEKYKPDGIWFDAGGGALGTEKILAAYFNMAEETGQEVCVHNKGNFGEHFGVYSFENGTGRPAYVDWPWEDDTPSAVGWCDWPWFKKLVYKKPRDVVVRLCDLVARNGGLLLSLNPPPDGVLEKGQVDLLLGIGGWLDQNGEAIFDTVPWKIYAEGNVKPLFYRENDPISGKHSPEKQPDTSKFTPADVRFTRNGENLYAMVLGIPANQQAVIKSLSSKIQISDTNQIKSVELLGAGRVDWKRTDEALLITLPEKLPNEWALAFKIQVTGALDKSEPVSTPFTFKERGKK